MNLRYNARANSVIINNYETYNIYIYSFFFSNRIRFILSLILVNVFKITSIST